MKQPLRVADILRELVAMATPSAVSNLPLIQWVDDFLQRRGWQVEVLPYEDDKGISKANLIARPSKVVREEQIELAFVCHTDTVPFARDWPYAQNLTQVGEHLHGCGACDVKGALACFLASIADLAPREIAAGTALILTADEEIGCRGMERLVASNELRIRSAIVSEPTSMQAGIAGKGYGLARVVVAGREAHSAFPQQGVSAISIAARLIAAIEDGFEREQSVCDPDILFDPPHSTINIGTIVGGSAKNIIAGRCTFLVEWRALPGDDPLRVPSVIQSSIEQVGAANPTGVIGLEVLRAEPGFSPASGGSLRMRLEHLLGGAAIGISFGSEASRIARIASEVIVLGPGDMRTAHSDRECVPIAELELWTRTLRSILVDE